MCSLMTLNVSFMTGLSSPFALPDDNAWPILRCTNEVGDGGTAELRKGRPVNEEEWLMVRTTGASVVEIVVCTVGLGGGGGGCSEGRAEGCAEGCAGLEGFVGDAVVDTGTAGV
jgi:hypothetical protein